MMNEPDKTETDFVFFGVLNDDSGLNARKLKQIVSLKKAV